MAASEKRTRVRLSQHAKEILWSESAGFCQNPGCRLDLHSLIERATVGELAHIIPASEAGPRSADGEGVDDEGRAKPENVLVLCPNCHTVIDKDPDSYPATALRGWKKLSQRTRLLTFGAPRVATRAAARAFVEPLLAENAAVHRRYAPAVDIFDDVRADQWKRQLVKVILPNNHRLVAFIRTNDHLLTKAEGAVFQLFVLHVEDLRARHEESDWTPGSVQFPADMNTIFVDMEPMQGVTE